MRKRERVAEIVRVFANLAVEELRATRDRSRDPVLELDAPDPRARALRVALERLGPFYVKVGQMLSTRPDLVPQNVIRELELLHDRVSVTPFSDFQPVLESNLGHNWSRYFSELDVENPIGAASLAQVYGGTLKSGEDVVLKIQRPGIARQIETDMAILHRVVRTIAKHAPALADGFDPESMLESVFSAMRPEIDFVIEAANMEEYTSVTDHFDYVAVPQVMHVTKEVLVMSRAPGTSIRYCNREDFPKEERLAIALDLFASTTRSLLVEGTFHADPHPGNIFVAPGHPATLIDFGMMGRFDRRLRYSLTRLLFALSANDGVGVAVAAAEIGRATARADLAGFMNDLQRFVPTITTGSLDRLDFGLSFTRMLTYFKHRGIVPNPALALMGKSFSNIEGSVRYLAPELSIIDIIEESLRPVIIAQARDLFSEEEMARSALDVVATAQLVPEQLRLLGQQLTSGRLTIGVHSDTPPRSRAEERADARSRRTRRAVLAAGAGFLWWQSRRARSRR